MRKLISFMHISLDGFVAGVNGEMDWINFDDELFKHVEQRISKGDTACYGRVTYQMMESYWPTAADKPDATRHDIEHSNWYKKSKKIVLSKSLKDDVLTNTKVISDPLPDSINEVKKSEGNEILVFGSPTATHSLIQHNLIDGYWLFVNPVLLGKGIPLFVNSDKKTQLILNNTRQFNCGVTELNYSVEGL